MKKIGCLMVLLFAGVLIGCNNNVGNDYIPGNDNKFLSLKIVSKYSGYIYRVGLVGYSFDDLRILENESKTFELVKGIPGGNENVNVSVSFRPDSIHLDTRNPAQIKCNFIIGKTTVITLPETGNVIVSYE